MCIDSFFIMGSIFWSYFLTAGLCKGSCRWKPYEDIPDGCSILCLPNRGSHNSISFLHGLVSKAWWHEKAYERVAKTGKTYSDVSRKYNIASEYGEDEGRSVWFFIIPLAVLVGIAVATGDLVVAAIIAILVSMVLYIAGKIMTFSEFWDTFVKGFSDMLPIIILLISALTFQKDCK